LAAPGVRNVKLLQLNIWMGRLNRQILQLIEQEQPDILCLQEVGGANGAPIELSDYNMFNSLQFIQQKAGFEHSFFAPTLSFGFGKQVIGFGNAIISKYPLTNQQTVFTEGSYIDDHDIAKAFPQIRNLQLADLTVGDKTITVANHHGHWEPTSIGNDNSLQYMEKVITELHKASHPILFSADLNLSAESPAMRVFDGFLEDLTATHQLKTTLSPLGKVAGVACDHILVSPNIRVQNFYACEQLVSDHLGLVLEFDT
jgi:endonuclease/exonuclease/phosphatase family metal-dependent hydrolase